MSNLDEIYSLHKQYLEQSNESSKFDIIMPSVCCYLLNLYLLDMYGTMKRVKEYQIWKG